MNGTAKQPGVIPLTIFECFDRIRDYEEREFLFRVSYLEIYNESVILWFMHYSSHYNVHFTLL